MRRVYYSEARTSEDVITAYDIVEVLVAFLRVFRSERK